MRRGPLTPRVALIVLSVCCIAVMLQATEPAAIVAAAQNGDVVRVRELLKQGADVNASTGDGMSALHWAAMRGDATLAELLVHAGANQRARTRLGAFTALHLASRAGAAPVVRALLDRTADVDARTATGATPLMLAAASGNAEIVTALIDRGADVQATEDGFGETALMFAASRDRADAVRVLVQRGAKMEAASSVLDLVALAASAPDSEPPAPPTGPPRPPRREDIAGVTRPLRFDELVGTQGGLTALHFAARQGALASVKALVEGGDVVDRRSPGDQTTPLLMATINGHFDLAAYLLDQGADPNLASTAGVTPLYAAINVQWAPKASYPQPRAHLQQQLSYLELMTRLLDKGADPDVRLTKKVWYSNYVFDVSNVDEVGATAFWRAAYASDVDAMRLLVGRGAYPNIPTAKPPDRRRGDSEPLPSALAPMPVGGPHLTPLHATSGAGYGTGYAGNSHHVAPAGMMPAVKYLVEELHADVNAVDGDGNTIVHNAAARGDNEMIEYLVSHGADVTHVNRAGQTTVDLANGPIQRVEPFPRTMALLEKLGAKNNHKCVSC